jgi:hypothetical protein
MDKGKQMVPTRQTSIKFDPAAWNTAKDISTNIFLNRVKLEHEFPLQVNVPSQELKTALIEAENDDVVRYSSIENMMNDLKT